MKFSTSKLKVLGKLKDCSHISAHLMGIMTSDKVLNQDNLTPISSIVIIYWHLRFRIYDGCQYEYLITMQLAAWSTDVACQNYMYCREQQNKTNTKCRNNKNGKPLILRLRSGKHIFKDSCVLDHTFI